jgi:hypothetical protein
MRNWDWQPCAARQSLDVRVTSRCVLKMCGVGVAAGGDCQPSCVCAHCYGCREKNFTG